ncbi:hypothetical protein Q5P01_008126 [Channa striata]|uniref:Uncharacterized protein n=1 Tax=Channa striata TaxID=64152 RepID=A0AA88N4W7_CHASR|nr:hypothetical protein Q5P01_008126 [Channa striata]
MDNEEVRRESDQMCAWLQDESLPPETTPHDSQSEHLALVLAQEDHSMMGLSSPTEQVAYLLGEKTTLQENLKAAERQMERQGLTANFWEALQREYGNQIIGEELRQQTEDMLKNIDDMTKAYYEEVSQERNERQRLERDLEEVSGKLLMAQQEIQRLTKELDAAKDNLHPSEPELQKTMQELDNMMKTLEELKVSDAIKLHQAKEQNAVLDAENSVLMERVCTLESEKKTLLDQLAVGDAGQDVVADESISGEPLNNLWILSASEMDQEKELEIPYFIEECCSTKQAVSKSEMPDPCTAHPESWLNSVEIHWDKRLDQQTCLQQELNQLQTKLGDAGQLVSQNQLDVNKLSLGFTNLQSEVSEFHARIKLQELELSRKLEEAKQMKQDLKRTRDDNSYHLTCLNQKLKKLQTELSEEQQLASKNQKILEAQVNEAQARIESQDVELSQKAEEVMQMKQDLQRAQSLLTSAERGIQNEQEKSLELKRHITVLEQDNFKLREQLKQVQANLAQLEQSVNIQAAELEHNQRKISDLQLELERNSTNCGATVDLRITAADKKVSDMQHQLKSVQQQLRVEEARVGESICMEEDITHLSDVLSAMREQKHQEDMVRKLLQQRKKELQQQTELITERQESRNSQNSINRLQGELEDSQQECDRLHEELQQVLLQLDTNARKKYRAKQFLLKAMAQRDQTIQNLENDLLLALVLSEKEKERVNAVMEVNDKLLQEKRELLCKISKAEEIASKSLIKTATAHHRISLLEVENRQLQDTILKLSDQVSSLKSSSRLENLKKVLCSVSDLQRLTEGAYKT